MNSTQIELINKLRRNSKSEYSRRWSFKQKKEQEKNNIQTYKVLKLGERLEAKNVDAFINNIKKKKIQESA
jgi:hypothetical protein